MCLLRILYVLQGAFPGNLQLVFVLRPSRFIQRAIADIGIKLYRDDFKMKVPVSMQFFVHAFSLSPFLHFWAVSNFS